MLGLHNLCNNFFIRCTLLLANNFLYIPDKASIRPTVAFCFTMLCATNLDSVTGKLPAPVDQTRSIRHSRYCKVAPPEETYVISSYIDNLQSASSNIQNMCHQTFRFLSFILFLSSLPLKPKVMIQEEIKNKKLLKKPRFKWFPQ